MRETVTEKVIEDIFVADKSIIAEILGFDYSDLNLIARQKILNSGILDLLYLYKNEIVLIELKSVPFYTETIEQINQYHQDLIILQSENKLLKADIKKYIVATGINEKGLNLCKQNDIIFVKYDTNMVLTRYYENFREMSQFMNIQSGDFGVVRLGLLNSTLKNLGDGIDLQSIADLENRSIKTIKNRISVAQHLQLVGKLKENFYLTEFGVEFVGLNNKIDDRLNEAQSELIFNFLKENPFHSSITYSIVSVVESVFILSKNSYPCRYKKSTRLFCKIGRENHNLEC